MFYPQGIHQKKSIHLEGWQTNKHEVTSSVSCD